MTPETLKNILVPQAIPGNPQQSRLEKTHLEVLREEKEACDMQLVEILSRRNVITDAIGEEKSRLGMPVRVVSEEYRVLENVRHKAEENDLNPDMLVKIWEILMGEARERQKRARQALGKVTLSANELAE